jgi:hypothetical protein
LVDYRRVCWNARLERLLQHRLLGRDDGVIFIYGRKESFSHGRDEKLFQQPAGSENQSGDSHRGGAVTRLLRRSAAPNEDDLRAAPRVIASPRVGRVKGVQPAACP